MDSRISAAIPRAALTRISLVTVALLWIAPGLQDSGPLRAQSEAESVRRRLAGLHASAGTTLPPLNPADWSDDQIKRVRRLEGYYVCACEKENYTKTLEGCPDGCADEQKALIRNSVREGKTDAEIKRLMVDRYTARVIGFTPWDRDGKWYYIIPITAILLTFVVGIFVLRSWRKSGRQARATRIDDNLAVEDDALDQVRRELDRIE